MKLALLLKYPLIKRSLLKQVAYYANNWFLFKEISSEPSNKNNKSFDLSLVDSTDARIVVVAQMHYSQYWQSYASISKVELNKIIQLQKQTDCASSTIFQVIENPNIDGFDVKQTTFDEKFINLVGKKRILIPETELLANKDGTILSLRTPVGLLFISNFSGKVSSSYAKGLVSNIDTFKFSSGLPLESQNFNIEEAVFGQHLFSQLCNQNIKALIAKSALNINTWFKAKQVHCLYWAPLLTVLSFYIVTNSFLWGKSYYIEKQLEAQGSNVSQLLQDKRIQDQNNKYLASLSFEFSKAKRTHSHWSIIYSLLESDMTIERFNYAENKLVIRGSANNASKILAQLSQRSDIQNATFDGAVIKNNDKEFFEIDITPKNRILEINDDENITKTVKGSD